MPRPKIRPVGGDVLRVNISDCENEDTGWREPIIEVDGKTLSWQEFGKILTTYSGWGMRLANVPDDETQLIPDIRIINSREDDYA
jgi:nitrogen fixation protein